jgi:hypothetical protein
MIPKSRRYASDRDYLSGRAFMSQAKKRICGTATAGSQSAVRRPIFDHKRPISV